MDKLVCKNNEGFNKNLTINKIYDPIRYDKTFNTYLIQNDIGHLMWFNEIRFITLVEERRNKITKIKNEIHQRTIRKNV